MHGHVFNLNTQETWGRQISVKLRLASSTYQVLGQPGLSGETLSLNSYSSSFLYWPYNHKKVVSLLRASISSVNWKYYIHSVWMWADYSAPRNNLLKDQMFKFQHSRKNCVAFSIWKQHKNNISKPVCIHTYIHT